MTEDPRSGMLGSLFAPGGDEGGRRALLGEDHLGPEDFGALLERSEETPPPRAIAEHLSRCDDCRGEFVRQWREASSLETVTELPQVPWELERAAAAPPPRPTLARSWLSLRWLRPVPALSTAAAALVLFGVALLVGRPAWMTGAGPARSRESSLAAPQLQPVGPLAPSAPIVFEWMPVPGASAYEVVVADPVEGSETVLRFRTTSTRHELGPEERARLVPGRTYQWLLRTELGAGRWLISPPTDFALEP